MIIIVVITILPSIYMAYRIVNKSIFENNARKFVDEQFHFDNTQVVSKTFKYGDDHKSIDLLLIGSILDKPEIDSLKHKLSKYRLGNVNLVIHQGLNASHQLDFSQIKASILEDGFNKNKTDTIAPARVKKTPVIDSMVVMEMKILYPTIKTFRVTKLAVRTADSLHVDTQCIALASFSKPLPKTDIVKLERWLQQRYHFSSLQLIVQ